MNDLRNLAINLIAAAIAFFFGWFFNQVRAAWKFRNLRSFWRPFVSADLKIVTSIFIEEEHYKWERSGLVGVGDVLALGELEKQLQVVGVHNLPLTPSDQITGEGRRSSLILVGGPHSNRITAEVMLRLPLSLTFGEAKIHDILIYDKADEKTYSCEIDEDDRLVVDQGIVIRAANPFNRKRNVVILAGSFGFGTAGAALLLNNPELLSHPIVTSGASFEAAFAVDIAGGAPQQVELKVIRRLRS